jgi:hypothetical protein
MALVPGSLADDTLPATQEALYTVPVGYAAYLKFMIMFNTAGTTETILLHIKRQGRPAARQMGRWVLTTNQSTRVIDKEEVIILSAGDQLLGQTSNADAVDFVLCGATEEV